MTNDINSSDRDEVLSAFQDACAEPTAEDIISWTTRFPQFADDIRDHAAITLDWAAQDDVEERPLQQGRVNDAYSQALAGLRAGDATISATATNDQASFQELMAARGKTAATMEAEVGGSIGIGRSIIAALINGAMAPPIGTRFKRAVMQTLSINVAMFDQALNIALAKPRMGLAKSSGPPKINKRSYEDIVKTSGMGSDQIKHWLSED
jgi:hypothetical protein